MIKFILLLTTFAFGGDFTVLLSCEKLPKYIEICDSNTTPSETVIEAPTYTMTNNIVWGYGDNNGSAFIGNVEVRYLSSEVETFKVSTDTAGSFTAVVIPNEEFHVYAYDTVSNQWITHDVKFILRIGTTTGNLLWKAWKPETSRWISLDMDANIDLVSKSVTNIVYEMGAFE